MLPYVSCFMLWLGVNNIDIIQSEGPAKDQRGYGWAASGMTWERRDYHTERHIAGLHGAIGQKHRPHIKVGKYDACEDRMRFNSANYCTI